jgi:hypothetical protein
MIKRLLFFVTILLPYVAYGADPSSNLSVDVTPPGSSSTVPAGAATAGFTTLALNSDFSQPMAANWLGGCSTAGNGAPTTWGDFHGHTWWLNIWWSNSYQNCNTVQATDPVFGGTVLHMPWPSVDANYANRGTTLQTASWNYDSGNPGNGDAVTFPQNAYYEIVARITPVARGAYIGFWTWPSSALNGTITSGLEYDVIELDAGNLGNSDAGAHNWATGNTADGWVGFLPGGGLPTNFDATQYHTYGMRVTSNGTNLEYCSYVDNGFVRCFSAPGGLTATEATQREILIVQNACDNWNYGGCPQQGKAQDMYVKTMRVWSCANWQSTQCNGPVLTGMP